MDGMTPPKYCARKFSKTALSSTFVQTGTRFFYTHVVK